MTTPRPGAFTRGEDPRGAMRRGGKVRPAQDGIAALLAHDLRTQLAAVSMNLDFLLGEIDIDSETENTRAALNDCREANLRAVRLVVDVADAVQLATGERRANVFEVDGAEMVAEVARRVAPEAAARDVQVVWTAGAGTLRADAELLTRALERLVQRALWQTRWGGRVDIVLRSSSVSIRVDRAPVGDAGPPARSLGTHFAETAIRAQGGAMWTERHADGALVYRVRLEPCRRRARLSP